MSGDLSPSISFSKKASKNTRGCQEKHKRQTAAPPKRNLPGASDISRVPKGSGATNREFPESTLRIVDGLSPGKQGVCLGLNKRAKRVVVGMNSDHSWHGCVIFPKECGQVKRKKGFVWGESAVPSS